MMRKSIANDKASSDSERLKSGFTWRSFLALVYAIIVFEPALIWIYLTTGNMNLVYFAVPWATVILLIELSRLSGNPLTKQEAATIFLGSQVADLVMISTFWIYKAWYRQSYVAISFNLVDLIPDWFAPSPLSMVWYRRTFFDPAWSIPIIITLISVALSIMCDISIGFLTRQLYVETEKLPFPAQRISAEAILVMIEREPDRTSVFAISTLISMIYGLIVYAAPMIAQSLNYVFQPVPIPWFDFNYFLNVLGLRGASFGIATDLTWYAIGLIIPFNVVISMLLGSLAFYFFGNWLLIELNLTGWANPEIGWSSGINVSLAWQRSILLVWMCPLIGMGVAAGLLPLIRQPRIFFESIKSLTKVTKGKGTVSLWVIMSTFLIGTVGSVVLSHLLVPDFPIWIFLLLSVGWSFIFPIISARALGTTGLSLDIPNINYLTYYASGYSGVDVWFAPLTLESAIGAPAWCGRFKVLDMCDCTATSYTKCWLLAAPIAALMGWIYTADIWRIAQIPSALFPGVNTFWPTQAVMTSLWVTRTPGLFQPMWILAGFGVTAALYFIFDLMNIPISMIGVVTGCGSPIPQIVSIFLGSIISKIIMKVLGKEWWARNLSVVAAGLFLGEALMIVVGSAVSFIIRFMWILPY